ncbi:MAG: Mur ligase family protein, partial [Alphaproteobacteria bacterium]
MKYKIVQVMIFLKDILKVCQATLSWEDFPLSYVTDNSKYVQKDEAFFCFPSEQSSLYIEQAINQGTRVIISSNEICDAHKSIYPNCCFVECSNIFNAILELANLFYPKQPYYKVAVTGTKGKSSVVHFVRELWGLFGIKSASFGTLGLKTSHNIRIDEVFPPLTTLPFIDNRRLFHSIALNDIEHVIVEASSHGIIQERFKNLIFDSVALTNIQHDHLDYHQTIKNYKEAKLKLFSNYLGEIAVLNKKASFFKSFRDVSLRGGHKIISYGISCVADIVAQNVRSSFDGFVFDILFYKKLYKDIKVPLIGLFQLENLLCAMSIVHASGVPFESIINLVPKINVPEGRLEHVGTKGKARIFVDYAHTPEALEFVLQTLRQYTNGNVFLVFGCGGNRDVSKR